MTKQIKQQLEAAQEKVRTWKDRRDEAIRDRARAGEKLASIARDFALTRERVRQIVGEEDEE